MKPIPLVRKSPLATAISYLAGEGIPTGRHLSRAGLSAPSPDELEALMPLHQICDFLSSVARDEGIHDLGFRMPFGVEDLGTYGRLIAQGSTLHESVQISAELGSTYNSGLRIWLERHHDQVRYCQKYAEGLPLGRTDEVVHLALQNAMAAGSYLIGECWKLNRIELASGPIDLSTYFPQLADIPVSFSQPFTSLWLSASVMSAPVDRLQAISPTADAKTRKAHVESGPASDPLGQLEQVVESVLSQPGADLRLIAAIIGTSPRTLQRRLSELNLTFSRLLQRVRFRGTQRLLRDPDLPLNNIAGALGYSDLPNFTRAFKRWTGVGPNEFRRLHYDDEQD